MTLATIRCTFDFEVTEEDGHVESLGPLTTKTLQPNMLQHMDTSSATGLTPHGEAWHRDILEQTGIDMSNVTFCLLGVET